MLTKVEIFSEKGGIFKLFNPWKEGALLKESSLLKKGAHLNSNIIRDEIIEIQTEPGQKFVFIGYNSIITIIS
jgi:hypothetical protein